MDNSSDEAFVRAVDWRRFVDQVPERIMAFLMVLRECRLDGGFAGFAQHDDLVDDRVMRFSVMSCDGIPSDTHAADMQIFLGTNATGAPEYLPILSLAKFLNLQTPMT